MLTLLKIFSSYLISSKHSGKVWGTSKKKKKTHCRKYVLINLWRLHIKDMNTLSFIHVNILFFIIFVCNVRIFMFLCNHIIRQNFLYYLCWKLCFSTLVTHWNHWKSFENYCYLDFPAFLLSDILIWLVWNPTWHQDFQKIPKWFYHAVRVENYCLRKSCRITRSDHIYL